MCIGLVIVELGSSIIYFIFDKKCLHMLAEPGENIYNVLNLHTPVSTYILFIFTYLILLPFAGTELQDSMIIQR